MNSKGNKKLWLGYIIFFVNSLHLARINSKKGLIMMQNSTISLLKLHLTKYDALL